MTKPLEFLSYQELEEQKKKAIENWDGLMYVRVCDFLGMEPDVPDLYESGLVQKSMSKVQTQVNGILRESRTIRSEIEKQINYTQFLKEIKERRVNMRSFQADTDAKIELVSKYFAYRFGDKAAKPIANYIPYQVGKRFSKLVREAEKETRQ